jgi:ribosomal protein L7/L12
MFGRSAPAHSDPHLAQRLDRIEQKLDAILNAIGLQDAAPAAPDLSAVRSLALSGRKIEAIKVYRELTGAGLADAKAAVEAME